jgi:hypothetical protein
VDYVRLLPLWEDITPMFKKEGDKYNLDQPNETWDRKLDHLCYILQNHGVKVAFDLMDQCAVGKPWNPYEHNINGVHGIYDVNDCLLGYLQQLVLRAKNAGVDIIGLGNELQYPGDNAGLHKWCQAIILPLARMIMNTYKPPFIYYSAAEDVGGTANKIRAYLYEPDYGAYKKEQIIEVIHGMGTPAHWKAIYDADIFSVCVSYGISDDGVGMGSQTLKPDERGLCEEPNQRCKANPTTRLATAQTAKKDMGDRLRIVEYLPPEIAMNWTNPTLLSWDYSVDVYRKLLKDIYGIEPPTLFYWDGVLCGDNMLLATQYCPHRISAVFLQGEQPTAVCPVHKKPEDPVDEPDDEPVDPKPDTRTCWQKYMGPRLSKWQPLRYLRCLWGKK